MIKVVQHVTDGDKDTDSSESKYALDITFKDDGPTAGTVEDVHATAAVLDETGGLDTGVTIDKTSIQSLFGTSSYGEDGAGSVVYGLNAATTSTGLYLTGAAHIPANEIQLVAITNANGVVTAYEGLVGGTGGAKAFDINIATDGTVTIDQIKTLDHPVAGSTAADHDDAVNLRRIDQSSTACHRW